MAKKGGKIALALGLVTGAVTGILFAPGKGKDLRKRITSERKIGGTGAKALGKDIKRMGEEIFDMMHEIAELDEVQGAWSKLKGETAKMTKMKKEDIDEIVAKAHKKAEDMKKLVNKYANHKKKTITKKVTKKAKAAKKKVKKAETKARKTVKKAATKVKKAATKIEKKASPRKRTK